MSVQLLAIKDRSTLLAQRHTTIIDLGRSSIRALQARRAGRGHVVTQAWSKDIPTEIERTDAQATGGWIRQELRVAGFKPGAATVLLAREDVIIKRLSLPTKDVGELPEMTFLAMQRELSFDATAAVIDFQLLESDDVNCTILAVAVPNETLALARRTVRAAGFKVKSVSLRAFGSVAMVADRSHLDGHNQGGTLTLDVTSGGVEFCVVERGKLQFSRAADLNEGRMLDDMAEAVLTETTRTWTSFRMIDEGHAVDDVVVFAPDCIRSRIAAHITSTVEAPVRAPSAEIKLEVPNESMDELWPAAGLLISDRSAVRPIDLAHPARAIDRNAVRRRRIGLAAALVVLAICAVWALFSKNIAALDTELEGLSAQRNTLYKEYARHFRDQYRLSHLEFWESAQIDVLGHLIYTQQLAPENTELVLDRFVGLLEFPGVDYDRSQNKWSVPQTIKIVVDGEAPERVTADDYRQALVDDEVYSVSSTGADAENGTRLDHAFTYRLSATQASPELNQAQRSEPES